jgi:hypothetical protein
MLNYRTLWLIREKASPQSTFFYKLPDFNDPVKSGPLTFSSSYGKLK